MSETKYTLKDAAKDTGASTRETSQAFHDARKDAVESGYLKEKAAKSESKNKK